jgi:hypothetical protein
MPSLLMVSRDLAMVLNDRYSQEAEAQDYLEHLSRVTSAPSITSKSS